MLSELSQNKKQTPDIKGSVQNVGAAIGSLSLPQLSSAAVHLFKLSPPRPKPGKQRLPTRKVQELNFGPSVHRPASTCTDSPLLTIGL
ncbi:hypothetical protein EYF80_035305 [Liparis tanakae]|uniref:Uncharacterized protein n=1 Tax=Liparis tanakae TaxID=230148 RepID=A0A4Z2GLP5_9TELE|nr:hypothetical protein EYF80_035305 [Liparis tanakae]